MGWLVRGIRDWTAAADITTALFFARERSKTAVGFEGSESGARQFLEKRSRRVFGACDGYVANQDLMNASKSALMVSASVVGIPCGNPL
jgi:hypothetical protein